MLDFKQQLQYAYLNDRPAIFEKYVEESINEINETILSLTKQNKFELAIMAYDSMEISKTEAYKFMKQKYPNIYILLLEEDNEKLAGFYSSDFMNSLWDYYEDQDFYMNGLLSKSSYFVMDWKNLIEERTKPFTEKELFVDSMRDVLKSKDIDYKSYLEEIKSKIIIHLQERIKSRTAKNTMIVELVYYGTSGEQSIIPKFEESDFIYHINKKRLSESGYALECIIEDIQYYLHSLGVNTFEMKKISNHAYSIDLDLTELISEIVD